MKLYFYQHDHGTGMRRVRRDDWPSDSFELMSEADFAVFQSACRRFGFPLIDGDFEELEEETTCTGQN